MLGSVGRQMVDGAKALRNGAVDFKNNSKNAIGQAVGYINKEVCKRIGKPIAQPVQLCDPMKRGAQEPNQKIPFDTFDDLVAKLSCSANVENESTRQKANIVGNKPSNSDQKLPVGKRLEPEEKSISADRPPPKGLESFKNTGVNRGQNFSGDTKNMRNLRKHLFFLKTLLKDKDNLNNPEKALNYAHRHDTSKLFQNFRKEINEGYINERQKSRDLAVLEKAEAYIESLDTVDVDDLAFPEHPVPGKVIRTKSGFYGRAK